MELETSLIAAQNGIVSNPAQRDAPRVSDQQQQQQQQANTQLPPTQVVIRQGNSEAFKQADDYRQSQTFYDKPEGKARQALAAYQSLQLSGQRDEIKQSLGVDTYV